MFHKLRAKKVTLLPEEDPNSIGNLAVEKGFITQEDLTRAVTIQKERLPLGEILIDMGKLSRDQLEELLFEQDVRKGNVKDRKKILQFEKKKRHLRIQKMKDGFADVRQDIQKLGDSVTLLSPHVQEK